MCKENAAVAAHDQEHFDYSIHVHRLMGKEAPKPVLAVEVSSLFILFHSWTLFSPFRYMT